MEAGYFQLYVLFYRCSGRFGALSCLFKCIMMLGVGHSQRSDLNATANWAKFLLIFLSFLASLVLYALMSTLLESRLSR